MTTDTIAKTQRNLIANATHADTYTRDQFQPAANVPHIAPGWNALTVLDVIAGAFLEEASDSTGLPIDECQPDLTDDELNQAVPGFTELVNKTVASHITSETLHRALREEARDLAQTVIRDMPPDQLASLLDLARTKVKDECSAPGDEDNR